MEASLTVDTSRFDRSLDAAEARIKRFEDEKHTVKVTAVFDSNSFGKARAAFAQLDQQISKDAMSRLRSNPQGSVLGALNALFSPHPVTGAPSPTQAAQQGLLGKIMTAPGGGGTAGPARGTSQGASIGQVLGSEAPPAQSNAGGRVSSVGLPKDTTTTDRVNVVGAPKDNSITTTDRVNTVGLPTSGGTITTEDRVNVTGLPTSGGRITTEDVVEPRVDETTLKAGAARAGKDAADAADDAMTREARAKGPGWFSGFLSGISGLFSGGGAGDKAASDAGTKAADSAASAAKKEAAKQSGSILASLFGGGGGGDSGGSALDKGLVGGIGPGILGTSFKTASIAGLLGAGIGGIPALVAGTAPLAVGAAGAGILTAGAKALIGQKNTKQNPNAQGPLYDQAQAAGKALQDMVTSAASGLITPLKNLFAQIPAIAKQVTPALAQVFSGTAALIQPVVTGLVSAVKQIGPGLGEAFRAAGPLLQPLITGLGSLVAGLLPGLVSLLHAAAPAVQVLSQFFGTLGTNLGVMFRDFSTVIGPSSVILKALLDVVTGLLPVFGSLAQILASTIGPAFTAFAGAIRALEPFLVTVGKIFAQFAGAVLQDLAAGLQLVAAVLKAVAPSLDRLAAALGQVFSTLESKGVFAQFGNILEGLAVPLGNLISKLIDGLAPAIPPLLTLFSDFVNVISNVGVQVLSALIPPLTQLAETALGAIMRVLPVVIPVVTQFLSAFTADAGRLISVIGASLLNLANTVLVALLQAAQPLIPVILGLVSAFTPLLNVLTAATATAIAAVADALAAVVRAIPSGALTAVIAGVAGVIAGMKLWDLAITGVLKGMYLLDAVMGSSLVTSLAGAASGIRDFMAATEGATLAQKALLAGQVALEAAGFAWLAVPVGLLGALSVALVKVSAQSQTIVGEFAAQQQQLGYNISGYQKLAATIDTASQGYAQFAQRSTDAVRGGAAGAQALSQQLSAQATQVSAAAVAMGQRLDALTGTFGVSRTTIEQWASAAGISATQFSGAGENVGKLTGQIADFVNKNAVAVTSTASLGTNIAIFGNDVFSATTQLDAFNGIWNTLVGNLLTKQQAVTQGQQAFDNLKQSIADNGKTATTTQQSFQAYISQIQSSLDSLEKGGASVSTLNSYLQTQISNLQSLGPLNKGQQQDLDNLRAFQDALANSTHGLNGEQKTMISQFENSLIPDLQKIGADTPAVTTDISNLANSIIQTGNNSASTKADRAQLIADLKQAGLTSQQAAQLVDGLQGKIDALKGKVVSVDVHASGSGSITATENIPGGVAMKQSGHLVFFALGGQVPGLGSGDTVPAMLTPGEVVVPKGMVEAGAVDHLRGKLPGFASGGLVGSDLGGLVDFVASQGGQYSSDAGTAFANAAVAAFQKDLAAAAAAVPVVATAGSAGGVIATAMRNMAAARGWTGSEWNALYALEMAEAGFNMTATNPSSGAYGLAQFINGPSEYATYGGNSTTATGQITAMLNYIAQRYGDPIAAEAHEQAYHWYDRGGYLKPGYTLAYNGTGKLERVIPNGGGTASFDDVVTRLDRLIRATEQVPAGVGAHVGGALNGAAHDASFRSRYPRGGS